jgi:methionine--tRNA ligase beta chain
MSENDVPQGPFEGPPKESPKEPPSGSQEISIEDFGKLDLRVAKVVAASTIEGADRLLKLQIEVGGETRQLVAGIKKSYAPEDLVGRSIIVVFNLKPARLRGVESQGMLLAAQTEEGPVLASFDKAVPSGSRVK